MSSSFPMYNLRCITFRSSLGSVWDWAMAKHTSSASKTARVPSGFVLRFKCSFGNIASSLGRGRLYQLRGSMHSCPMTPQTVTPSWWKCVRTWRSSCATSSKDVTFCCQMTMLRSSKTTALPQTDMITHEKWTKADNWVSQHKNAKSWGSIEMCNWLAHVVGTWPYPCHATKQTPPLMRLYCCCPSCGTQLSFTRQVVMCSAFAPQMHRPTLHHTAVWLQVCQRVDVTTPNSTVCFWWWWNTQCHQVSECITSHACRLDVM